MVEPIFRQRGDDRQTVLVHMGNKDGDSRRVRVIGTVVHPLMVAQKNQMGLRQADFFPIQRAVPRLSPVLVRLILGDLGSFHAVVIRDEGRRVALGAMPGPVSLRGEHGPPIVRVAGVRMEVDQ